MTEKVKPATDADIQGAEKMAEGGWSSVEDTLAIIARIRQEQRRAEAAERVVEAARVLIEDDVEIMGRRRPCKTHGITSHVVGEACSICDAYAAYDAAKAAGFPEDKR